MTRRTRIKICGVTSEDAVDAAVEAGADAVGFVIVEASPRHVTLEQARSLAERLPPFVTAVGLFVNAPHDRVEEATRAVPSLVLQFHGDESADECVSHARPFLKAVPMSAGVDLLDWVRRYSSAQGFVLDAPAETRGGSGKAFDWSLVPADYPHASAPRLVLSGGLHAANVGAAISLLRPWAVDVSSGVESRRGVKDAEAIRRFCDAVREADAKVGVPTA